MNIKIRLLNFLIAITGLFYFLFSAEAAKSQEADRTVTGIVTSSEGEMLPGVNIVIQGTTTGTSTDIDGNYSISVSSLNDTLVFSYIGFQSQEIPISGQTTINVELIESELAFDEVVVVGYGTQRRSDVIGSVINVDADQVVQSPAMNMTESLMGRLPGVVMIQQSGEPGRDDAEIFIRGRNTMGENSPLIVIDGVADRRGLSEIDPNEVESITVLKDASAAIYGARAANGVILINTKRGITGGPTFSYSSDFGIVQPTRLPEYVSTYESALVTNERRPYIDNLPPPYSEEDLQYFQDGSRPLTHANTDWVAEVLKPYNSQHQHNLSVRGGGENIRYYASGHYAWEDGIVKNSMWDHKKYSFRTNIDAQITNNLEVSLDFLTRVQDKTYPALSHGSSATSRIIGMLGSNRQDPVFYPGGLPSPGVEYGYNPAIMASEEAGYDDEVLKTYQIKASFDLMIPWIQGLSVDGFLAYDINSDRRKIFTTPYRVYRYDPDNDIFVEELGGTQTMISLEQFFTENTSSIINLILRYEQEFGEIHRVSTMLGGEQAETSLTEFSAYRDDFISKEVDNLFAGSTANMQNTGREFETARQNVFGRVNYRLMDRYMLDLTFRYDGSFNFAKGQRWGFFPGIAAGWTISEEPFLKNQFGFLDELRLRGSWGIMGNDQIPPFQYLSGYLLTTGMWFGTDVSPQTGLQRSITPNPYVTWETARTANIALDGSLWEGRLDFAIDFFHTRRSDILIQRELSVPVYTGLSLPAENFGIVENKGFEVELLHRGRPTSEFSYRIGGNFSLSGDVIVEMDEPSEIPEYQRATGHRIGSGLYYEANGIFRTQEEIDNTPHMEGTLPGDLIFKDVNGDGVIDSRDRVRLSETNDIPDIVFGVNLGASYRNFYFDALFQGQSGIKSHGTFSTNRRYGFENRYSPGSMDSPLPLRSRGSNTFFLQDLTYIRLKNLEVGYHLPQSLISPLGINRMRLYVSGTNLFTLDRYPAPDVDPAGIGGTNYFISRVFNLGANINF